MSARPEFLDAALACGAVLTGKPNGSEAVTVVFTPEAWQAFDAQQGQAAPIADYSAYWKAGFTGQEICPTTRGNMLAAYADGIAARKAAATTAPADQTPAAAPVAQGELPPLPDGFTIGDAACAYLETRLKALTK